MFEIKANGVGTFSVYLNGIEVGTFSKEAAAQAYVDKHSANP